MRQIIKATIPAEHVVYTREIDFTDCGGTIETVEYATGRTSKGNETHVVHASVLGGLASSCGLDMHGRTYHSVWSVQKAPITCEKCNGAKTGKNKNSKAAAEYRRNTVLTHWQQVVLPID